MKDSKNPMDIFNAILGNLTSGNPIYIAIALSFLTYTGFSVLSFIDGVGGRGCGSSPRFNNLFSWYLGGGCAINGFVKPLPRHEGVTNPSRPR